MTAVVAVLTLVVALLAFLVAGLLRSHAEILRRLHELGAGLEEPGTVEGAGAGAEAGARPGPGTGRGRQGQDVVGVTPAGDPIGVSVRDVTHDTVLLFLSSGCTTCATFWRQLTEPGTVRLPEGTRLVVVTHGPGAESPAAVADLAPDKVTVVMSDAAWEDYRVAGTPYVVHVTGRTGRVRGEGTGLEWPQVARLLAQATGDDAFTGAGQGRGRRKAAGDAARERRIDVELAAAGIHPGDPSLYPADRHREAPDGAADRL